MYHIMPWQTNKILFILLSQHLAQCQNSVADALRARAQRCAVLYPLQILADGSTALFLIMNEEKSESRRAVKLPPYPGLEKVHRANLRLLKEKRSRKA